MRIAYINNHNSAGAFFSDLFINLGYKFWLPLNCPENGTLRGAEAELYRNIDIDEERSRLIDGIDFYSNTPLSSECIKVFDDVFDLIILIGSTRFVPMLQIAEFFKTQILIYEWGDVGGVFLHQEYFPYYSRINIKVVTQFPCGIANNISGILPLGLNDSIFSRNFINEDDANKTGMVISRISHNGYTRMVYDQAMSKIINKDYLFSLIGKDNKLSNAVDIYISNWKGIQLYSDISIMDVYQKISEMRCFIYPIEESAMLQYAPIEAIYLGVPVIFSSKSILSRLMGKSPCCVDSFEEITKILDAAKSNDWRQEVHEKQYSVIQYFLSAKKLWENFIALNYR